MRDAMQTSAAVLRKARKEELQNNTSKSSQVNSKKLKKLDATIVTASDTPDAKDAEAANSRLSSPSRTDRPKDFATLSSSVPRRLNDILQAPPEIKKLPRGAKARQPAKSTGSKSDGPSLRDGVLSMAQKAMLEEERNRVIKAYREMKKRNANAGD